MPRHTLHPYQRETVDAIRHALDAGVQRPAGVLPTGGGKSLIAAALLAELHVPRSRSLIVAHRRELVDQNAAEIRGYAPHLRVGTMIGADRRGLGGDIISASIQTLVNAPELVEDVRTLVIDECHHATADTYRRVLDYYGCFAGSGKGANAVGITATMSRSDRGALGSIWQDVVYTVPISQLIADGYLVRPFGKRIVIKDLDLSRVRQVAGDLQKDALGTALEDANAPDAIAHAYREHAADRPGIIFMPTVHSADLVVEAMRAADFTTEGIYGHTPKSDRKRTLDRYKLGHVQVLVNAMVLTEGTNLPMTSCIVVARPTRSQGLYVQMAGRGLRLHPESGKTDCLILDIAGVTRSLKLASPIDLFTAEEVKKERPDGFDDFLDDEPEEVEPEPEPPAAIEIKFTPKERAIIDWSGRLDVEEIDLFGVGEKRGAAWEITRGGIWFVPVGTDHYLAVIRSVVPGHWDVVRAHRIERGRSEWVARAVRSLADARMTAEMSVRWGEKIAERASRRKSGRATPRTFVYATDLGLPVTPEMTAGEVSTLIDIELASRRLDPSVPQFARR